MLQLNLGITTYNVYTYIHIHTTYKLFRALMNFSFASLSVNTLNVDAEKYNLQ